MDEATLRALRAFPDQLEAHFALFPAAYRHWVPASWDGVPSEALTALARETQKPIAFWSYTQIAPESAAVLSAAGFPLTTSMHNCARALRALHDYRVARERFMAPQTESKR